MITIRGAEQNELNQVARLVTESVFHLATSRHLVPDTQCRTVILCAYHALWIRHAFTRGVAVQVAIDEITGGILGAAVWYPSGDPGPDDYNTQLTKAIGARRADRFRQFDHMLRQHAPTAVHDHLGQVAVAPDYQGRGIGDRLLREGFGRLDGFQIPAYLVAPNQRSAALFARNGYRPLGDAHELGLPNGVLYRMWREPRDPPSLGQHRWTDMWVG